MSETPVIILVDDEESVRGSLSVLLKTRIGAKVLVCGNSHEAGEALGRGRPDVVITDVFMEGQEAGLQVLENTRRLWPETPVILMSAVASKEAAIKALNAKAFYFLEKPFANELLIGVVKQALASGSTKFIAKAIAKQAGSRRHNHAGERKANLKKLVGESGAWLETVTLVEQAANSELTVLLEGESGVGKGILAAHLHEQSRRSQRPFLSVNCGSLTETLLESQLFGHIKGAFTGADKDSPGMVRAAEGGTLFLDEIGEMSLSTQVRLLQVLQERTVIPVGDTKPISVDVRFVAATNRILRGDVLSGRFREDLFYRLNVISVKVPALRERIEDLDLLARHILLSMKQRDPNLQAEKLTERAMEVLSQYDWPGNIRELENALARATLSSGALVDVEDLPKHIRNSIDKPSRSQEGDGKERIWEGGERWPSLAIIESAYASWIVNELGGDKVEAAKRLGVSPGVLEALLG